MIHLHSSHTGSLTRCLLATACVLAAGTLPAQEPVLGDYWAHDPSTMIKDGSRYDVFRTSPGIMGRYSTDLRNWTYSGQVFPGNPPAWGWSKQNLHSKLHR